MQTEREIINAFMADFDRKLIEQRREAGLPIYAQPWRVVFNWDAIAHTWDGGRIDATEGYCMYADQLPRRYLNQLLRNSVVRLLEEHEVAA